MKYLLLIGVCMICMITRAQSYIKPRNLQVTNNRTTNIIFPAQISSIDRGSERIVVQKSTGNILRVKADSAFSDTTNLTVVTSDGKLYSFLVSYTGSPAFLNIDLGVNESLSKDTALFALSQKIINTPNNLHGIRYSSGRVKLSVTAIYTTGEVIICKLRIENNSSLSFEPARLKCYAGGLSSSKRRPNQQIPVDPLLVNPSSAIVKERQALLMALILPKTALGRGQGLQLDITEKDGDRQLSVILPNKYLLHALIIH